MSVPRQPAPPKTLSCVPCTGCGLSSVSHWNAITDRAPQQSQVLLYLYYIYTWEAKQTHRRCYLCGQRGERLTDNWLHQISKLGLSYSLCVLSLPPLPGLHESVELEGKYSQKSYKSRN